MDDISARVVRAKQFALAGWYFKDWYSHAYDEVSSCARTLGVDHGTLAGLLAAYSPRVQVHRSIEYAIHWCLTRRHHRGVMAGVQAAVEYFLTHGTLRGRKTEAFRLCLQGVVDAVVLDTHMAEVLDLPQRTFSTSDGYATGVRIVLCVSSDMKLTPSQAQAAMWGGRIRMMGRSPAMLSVRSFLPTLFME